MKAGLLNQWVRLERKTQGQDDYGQPIDSWTHLAATFAAVEPLTGREYLAAQAVQSEVTVRIHLRFRPDISLTTADRVIHGEKIYDIVSIINYRSLNIHVELMCRGR